MVKAYLRYEQRDAFGVIASPNCNAVVHPDGSVFAGALESVLRWSVRRGVVSQRYTPARASGPGAEAAAEVVRLELDGTGGMLAAGHFDGRIRLWDLASGTERVALYGHKRAVTALRFDRAGLTLASGSADTDVVLWDVTAEAGLFRLHGHRDAVTDLCFLGGAAGGSSSGQRHLLSCGKDGLLKVWALTQQACVHTAVGHTGEVWALDASPDGALVVSAGADDDARLWRVQLGEEGAAEGGAALLAAGSLPRRGKARAVSVRFDAAGALLAIASLDRAVDLFAVRSAAEVRRATKRRQSRAGERAARKAKKAQSGRFVDEEAAEGEEAEGAGEEGEEVGAALDLALHFSPLPPLRASAKLCSASFLPAHHASADAPPSAAHRAAAAALGAALGEAEGAGRRGTQGVPPGAVLVVCLRSNALAAYAVPRGARAAPAAEGVGEGEAAGGGGGARLVGGVDACGHRSEVRALCMSGDGRLVGTVSDGQACVWAADSGGCLHALPCGYGLCCAFVAASTHLLVGTKGGELQLFALASASLAQSVDAHEGKPVWALCVQPGGLGLLSAGGDKALRTWVLEALRAPDGPDEPPAPGGGGGRVVGLRLGAERLLRLTDEALAVCASADGRLLCVSLLDGTLKVLFADSLKFYLSLYGHKLPALCADFSSDGALIASGGADKSVKLWGTDFGDCRRSLHAHAEAVTAVRFVRETHYLFSASKDRSVRYWDADAHTELLVLHGHRAEVWALDTSRDGNLLATAGRDRSVRVWARTDEQLFVEEEREAQLEALFVGGQLQGERDQDGGQRAERALARVDGGEGDAAESGGAGKRSLDSLRGTERLLEALSVLKEDDERAAEFRAAMAAWAKAGGTRAAYPRHTRRPASAPRLTRARPPSGALRPPGAASGVRAPVLVPNGLLLGKAPAEYLLHALRSVRPADLEQVRGRTHAPGAHGRRAGRGRALPPRGLTAFASAPALRPAPAVAAAAALHRRGRAALAPRAATVRAFLHRAPRQGGPLRRARAPPPAERQPRARARGRPAARAARGGPAQGARGGRVQPRGAAPPARRGGGAGRRPPLRGGPRDARGRAAGRKGAGRAPAPEGGRRAQGQAQGEQGRGEQAVSAL